MQRWALILSALKKNDKLMKIQKTRKIWQQAQAMSSKTNQLKAYLVQKGKPRKLSTKVNRRPFNKAKKSDSKIGTSIIFKEN